MSPHIIEAKRQAQAVREEMARYHASNASLIRAEGRELMHKADGRIHIVYTSPAINSFVRFSNALERLRQHLAWTPPGPMYGKAAW